MPEEKMISDDRYRSTAREMYAAPGAIEIDADAKVSRAEDESGAYIHMWVWVGRESAGFDPSKADRIMVMYCDPEGKTRAWGIAVKEEHARCEAERQLEAYREKKREVGDLELANAHYTEVIRHVE